MFIANPFLGRLRWHHHECLQHVPSATERFLLFLELAHGLLVLRRILFRISDARIFREEASHLFCKCIGFLCPVFASQLELKANRESMRIECRESYLNPLAQIIP